MSNSWNESHRFGSARWAEFQELHRARMFSEQGWSIGFAGGRMLRYGHDAPMLTIGGAGTGKLRDVIGHVFCGLQGGSVLVLDPRGEIAATFLPALTRRGIHAYFWNPFGLHGLPSHSCNPLDPIDPKAPTFHSDCTLAARALITVSSKAEGKYFEQRASGWVEAILRRCAEVQGHVTLRDLMAIVNLIESGARAWPDFLEGMMASRFDDVRRTAGEMLVKQQDSPREFGSIMGEIYAGLGILDDPALQRALAEPDFSMAKLCEGERGVVIFLMAPAEYLRQMAPVLRLMLTAARLHKGRSPGARRVLMLIDEAAQLGAFPMLMELYTFGRGLGIQAWTFWQGVGQFFDNFGPTGAQTFFGSSGMQQIIGVRDYQTAKLVSDLLGTETLEFDDTKAQELARYQRLQATQRFVSGGDPFEAALQIAHFGRLEQMRSKQARKKMTEEEVLSLPGNQQLLFVPALNLHPIRAERQAYFGRPEYAGQYLPNPYHPPFDSVPIVTRWGARRARVIREKVPSNFESFPQFSNGTWAYVEGYKPT